MILVPQFSVQGLVLLAGVCAVSASAYRICIVHISRLQIRLMPKLRPQLNLALLVSNPRVFSRSTKVSISKASMLLPLSRARALAHVSRYVC
ncbi:hypothetical protein F5Y11DRAFT_342903 [Daldinia sp. FL1419]|nr:hypothetical protein F5Y11DRAFT_342903 [Daldinia sp. FL1419]